MFSHHLTDAAIEFDAPQPEGERLEFQDQVQLLCKEARVLIEYEEELDQRQRCGNFSIRFKIFSSDSIWLDFVLRGLGERISSSFQ